MKDLNLNNFGNSLGIGDFVQLVQSLSTENPLFVHNVIDIFEQWLSFSHRSERQQQVCHVAKACIYHAWNRTWGTGLCKEQFVCQHKFVKAEFLLLCTELGTAIALRQKEHFGKLNAS